MEPQRKRVQLNVFKEEEEERSARRDASVSHRSFRCDSSLISEESAKSLSQRLQEVASLVIPVANTRPSWYIGPITVGSPKEVEFPHRREAPKPVVAPKRDVRDLTRGDSLVAC